MKKEKLVFVLILLITIIHFYGCLNAGPLTTQGSLKTLGDSVKGPN